MSRAFLMGCLALVAVMSSVAVVNVRGQQTQPQDSALLSEVRLLRQAIEALAGNGARVQIVFGRLQLQEQRTANAARRLDELRSALAAASTRASEAADRIKRLESAVANGSGDAQEQEALQDALPAAKQEWGRLEAERARLAAEESEAGALLIQEQGRWSDLNTQLEALERALTPRR
jgi:chromosome segregation ATPase